MPSPPLLIGGTVALLFAFLLGRCTAGDGAEVSTTNTTVGRAATTTTVFEIIHVVKEDETLAGIADQYNVTINEIAIANSIGDTNTIVVGQRLKIPPETPVTTTSTTLKKKNKNN
jgi:LysM repeat protein